MKKRAFFKKSIAGLGLLSFPLISKSADKVNGRFVHTVFFWLKPETDVRGFVTGTRQFLDQISVIKSYHLGQPAGTPREVVDNSYSACLVVTFDSKEDQDIYQKHEAHLSYVEERKDDWTRVQVYDSWGFE